MLTVLTPPTMGGTVAHMTHTETIYTSDDHAYLIVPGVLFDAEEGIEWGIDTDQSLAQAGEVALIDSSGEFAEVVSQRELQLSPRWSAVRRDDAVRVSLATVAELLRRSGQ